MDKVGLQKNSCKIIDVTNKRGTVETLTEAKISCAIEEKVCNSWADKEAKHFKIQDTLFITFYYCFEPNASTCTPHCLGTWSTEPQRCTKWNRRRTTKHTFVVKIALFRLFWIFSLGPITPLFPFPVLRPYFGFSNTVDCVRRLGSLFRLLDFDPWVLHASMQQRQRLKNLDRPGENRVGWKKQNYKKQWNKRNKQKQKREKKTQNKGKENSKTKQSIN